MKSKVRLNICGTDYYITSDDDESYIRAIGDEVDTRMSEMMTENDRISTTMAAVLCALTYADEQHKATAAADSLRAQIKDYVQESSKARLEADEARREIEHLRRELQSIRMRFSELQNR